MTPKPSGLPQATPRGLTDLPPQPESRSLLRARAHTGDRICPICSQSVDAEAERDRLARELERERSATNEQTAGAIRSLEVERDRLAGRVAELERKRD